MRTRYANSTPSACSYSPGEPAGDARFSGLDVRQIQAKGGALYYINDGKVTKLVLYFDRERMLADLDLPS